MKCRLVGKGNENDFAPEHFVLFEGNLVGTEMVVTRYKNPGNHLGNQRGGSKYHTVSKIWESM